MTKDSRKEYLKQYYIKNKDKILEYNKNYSRKFYTENKESILKDKKSRYYDNIIEERQKRLEYYYKNKERIIHSNIKYNRNKRVTDITYKLRTNFSHLVNYYMKLNNSSKNGKSMLKYFDYTLDQLKRHIESQFDNKMSWDNYGSYWHIDHIIPQSILPYTSMEDDNFKKCWDLKNLRPLEKIANIKKGNRLIEDTK